VLRVCVLFIVVVVVTLRCYAFVTLWTLRSFSFDFGYLLTVYVDVLLFRVVVHVIVDTLL